MTHSTPKRPQLPHYAQPGTGPAGLAPLDDEALLYFEAIYRVRLTRSGVVCNAVTGRKLVSKKGEQAAAGPTRLVVHEVGVYLVASDSEAHIVAFRNGRWHGGSIQHAARPSDSA